MNPDRFKWSAINWGLHEESDQVSINLDPIDHSVINKPEMNSLGCKPKWIGFVDDLRCPPITHR